MAGHASPNSKNGHGANGGEPPRWVNGGAPISIGIPGGADAPRRARSLTSPHLTHACSAIASDAQLIISELVTNSVRHGGVEADRMVTIDLALLEGYLRITVTDPGCDVEPQLLTENADGLGGHGLRLLDRLSAAWGVGRDAVGATQVWCDLVFDPGRGRGPQARSI